MSAEVTTLEAQWREYRDACYPPKNGPLPPLQEAETRQAFYAGILLALKIAVDSSQLLSEEAAFANIRNMINEAKAVCDARVYEVKGRN